MPKETLACCKGAVFCRAVQKMFLQAMDGDGSALVPVHVLCALPAPPFSPL